MNSREYWKKQVLKDKAASINRSERYITSTLSKCYREALKEIQQDIDKFYQSFADKNHITLAEAKRVISKKDFNEIDFVQLSKDQVKENQELKKLREQLPGEVFSEIEKKQKEYEKLLSAYTKKGEITRLELLQVEMEKELLHLHDRMQVNIYEVLSSEYQNHYYKTVFQTQKGLGFGKSFVTLNTGAIQKAVLKTYHASSYSKRIWGHHKQLSKEFREQITTGMIKGESIDKLTKRIVKRMDVSKSNAKRLVRTETAYVFEQAAKDAYEQCGIEEYEFLATLDLKTSKICQELDTKVFKVKDAMPGTNYPPMHPNCRSTTVCHFEDDVVTTRTARGTDGKTYEVPSDMTYKEWYKKHVLQEEDRGIIELTEQEEYALNNYLGIKSYLVNEKLREGKILSKAEKEMIQNLDSALEKLPEYQGDLKRSLYFYEEDSLKGFLKECQVGNEITYPSYTSATKGETYNPDGQVEIHILNSKKGKDISAYNEAEQEVLYKREQTFIVKQVNEIKGVHHIVMEEK